MGKHWIERTEQHMNLAVQHNAIKLEKMKREAFHMSEQRGLRTYTSYSGADIMTFFNGSIIGEVQAIHYEENLNATDDPPFDGYIEVAVFNSEPEIRRLIQKGIGNQDLKLLFANEHGDKMSVRFDNLVFTKRIGGFSIDNIVSTERYCFHCDDVIFDQRFYDLHNVNSRDNIIVTYRD